MKEQRTWPTEEGGEGSKQSVSALMEMLHAHFISPDTPHNITLKNSFTFKTNTWAPQLKCIHIGVVIGRDPFSCLNKDPYYLCSVWDMYTGESSVCTLRSFNWCLCSVSESLWMQMKRAVTVTPSKMDVSIFIDAYLHLHLCKVTGRQHLQPLLCAKKAFKRLASVWVCQMMRGSAQVSSV